MSPSPDAVSSEVGQTVTYPLTDAPATSPAPTRLPRYVLGDVIARGGMGVVHRATDTVLGREVAVKVLHEKSLAAAGAVRRFLAEARIAGRLQHPAIPPIHDLGELPDGRPFLAMKLIGGRTLAEELAARSNSTQDRPRFIAVLARVSEAVAYAHAFGVIHRDLKPLNVMVGEFGEVQVMDWGLAKELGAPTVDERAAPITPAEMSADPNATVAQQTGAGDLTRAGQVMGTPGYMPPEQARGDVMSIDRRADVFALGAMLCEVLTGSPPYGRDRTEVVLARATAGELKPAFDLLIASGADAELVALCQRCLAADPTARLADAAAVATALAEYQTAAEERARQAEVERGRAEEQRKRRRVAWGLAATAALLVVALLFAAAAMELRRQAVWASGEADQARRDAEKERDRVARLEYGRTVSAAHQAWIDNEVAEAVDTLDRTEAKYRGWEWAYLHRQFNKHTLQFDGCSFAALSADGRRCATWQSGVITVWNAKTGENLFAVHPWRSDDGQEGRFTPDGHRLATLWDTSRQPPVVGPPSFPQRDGDGVTVWDVDAKKAILEVATPDLKSFTLSADGGKLVVGRKQSVEIWDLALGKRTAQWEIETDRFRGVRCNRDASRVLTEEYRPDYVAVWRLWNPADPARPIPLEVNGQAVRSAHFSEDGRGLLTTTWEEIQLRDGQTGVIRWNPLPPIKGGLISVDSAAISPDGLAAAAARGHDIRVWDGGWSPPLTGPAEVKEMAFIAGGKRLIASYADCSVRVWDALTWQQLDLIRGSTTPAVQWDVSRDGNTLLTRTHAKIINRAAVRVWHLAGHTDNGYTTSRRDRPEFPIEWEGRKFSFWSSPLGGWHSSMLSGQQPLPKEQSFAGGAISPDGQRAAVLFEDGKMLLVDRQNNRIVIAIDPERNTQFRLTFSPDGSKLFDSLRTSRPNQVPQSSGIIWDTATGAEITRLKPSPPFIRTAAFSSDGRLLATGSDFHGIVRLWDTATGEQILETKDETDQDLLLLRFDGTGSRLAAVTDRHTVDVRDTTTGALLARLSGHTDEITSVAFHPRENRIATGSKDRSVRLWDTVNGAEVLRLRFPKGERNRVLVQFNNDGRELDTTTDGENYRTFDATPVRTSGLLSK